MANELTTELWKLSNTMLDVATRSKEMLREKKIWFTPKVENFQYEEGIKGYSIKERFSEREGLSIKSHEFVETEIKSLAQYKEIVSTISKTYNTNLQQADYWLSRFCQSILSSSISGITEEELVERVSTFIRDLENIPKEWSPTVWLDGIWMKTDKITLQEGTEIRRPTPSDIEQAFERPMELLMWPDIAPQQFPSAILVIKLRFRHQPEVLEEIERIVNVLRLYKVGSVMNIRTKWNVKSILELQGTTFRTSITESTYKYGIGSNDLERLKGFFQTMKPLIPDEIVKTGIETIDYITIALQRYNDSLLKPDTIEARLTSAIMCLEALYLKTAEREELSHRLAQRVAKVLSRLGNNPMEVYHTLKRAYDIRSKYVHGSQIEKEERQDLRRTMDMALEYARLSLVLLLQLRSSTEKQNFLNLVDNSLLSKEASDKLQDMLSTLTF